MGKGDVWASKAEPKRLGNRRPFSLFLFFFEFLFLIKTVYTYNYIFKY